MEELKNAKQKLAGIDTKYADEIRATGYGRLGEEVIQNGFDMSTLNLNQNSDEYIALNGIVQSYPDDLKHAQGTIDRIESEIKAVKDFQQQKEIQEMQEAMLKLPQALEQIAESNTMLKTSLVNESGTSLYGHAIEVSNELLTAISDKLTEAKEQVLSAITSPSDAPTPDPDTPAAPQSAPLLDAPAFAPTIGQAHDGIDSVPREGTWLLGQAATDFDDTMNGMQVQMLDLEDICQKTLDNVTQQMRDFGAATADTGQSVSGLEPAMNGIQEQMQGLEEIFQKTLNGRAIFESSHIGHEKTHLKSYYVLAA